jgi:sucrose phosphorylase
VTNQAQLIAYADRLPGGTLRDVAALLDGPFHDAFGGVHLLPFFHPIDGADAGFDPIDHTQVDPRLGTWADVKALTSRTAVMADLIVNHVSRHSPQFQHFHQHGEGSAYAGMFLTYARVFPDGASAPDLRALYTIRPTLPFTKHETAAGARGQYCGPRSQAIRSISTSTTQRRAGISRRCSTAFRRPVSR